MEGGGGWVEILGKSGEVVTISTFKTGFPSQLGGRLDKMCQYSNHLYLLYPLASDVTFIFKN